MIKQRYFLTDILKEAEHKSIQRVQQITKDNQKHNFICKKFTNLERKYFDNELYMYNVVLKDSYSKGFAQLKDIYEDKQNCYLFFNELGENTEALRNRCGGRFTLKTVLMIGLQILDRIQHLHSKGYIHGDIQPSNFLIGLGKVKHKIYLVDFQLSCPYIVNQKHLSQQRIGNFSGSVRFCSIEANNHKNMSRRDDIQSLMYSLIFMIKGYLPWVQLKSDTLIEAYNETARLKKQKAQQLLSGLPQAFRSVLNSSKSLKFQEKPNYDRIRNQLSNLMKKNGYELDYKYDWTYV